MTIITKILLTLGAIIVWFIIFVMTNYHSGGKSHAVEAMITLFALAAVIRIIWKNKPESGNTDTP